LNRLHDGDEADGEERQATHIRGGENEPAAVDGFARPNVRSFSSEIEDQIFGGDFWMLLRIGRSLRRIVRTDHDLFSDVIGGPGQGQVLVTKEGCNRDSQEEERDASPGESVAGLVPSPRREKYQPKNHRDDELPQAEPDFLVADRDTNWRGQEEAAEDPGQPERALRQHQPVFAGLLKPSLIFRACGHCIILGCWVVGLMGCSEGRAPQGPFISFLSWR